ncbi:hypothetical protein AB6B38_14425 (plasmid) [Glycocaulis abyssi]|uniref:hypothetical protein n=1 Tax=Glycocaulis abyssi TaxID=1433403 RepID=UPI00352A5148
MSELQTFDLGQKQIEQEMRQLGHELFGQLSPDFAMPAMSNKAKRNVSVLRAMKGRGDHFHLRGMDRYAGSQTRLLISISGSVRGRNGDFEVTYAARWALAPRAKIIELDFEIKESAHAAG